MRDIGSDSLDEQYLQEFTKLFMNEDHPNHNVSKQEIYNMALELLLAVQLVYKPIPQAKRKQYRNLLRKYNVI